MIERFRAIFLLAGVGCFAFAFVVMGWLPWSMLRKQPIRTVEELAATVPPEFEDLAARYPIPFREAFGTIDPASYAKAIRRGRDVYVAEGCWHCHSQYVRPVGNEEERWGAVSRASEYQHELAMPVLFGTRRIGPDLTREAGRRSNDWHAAHFFNPRNVVPTSVMPGYKWFFAARGDTIEPNARGLALIAYVQWLGSWDREGIR